MGLGARLLRQPQPVRRRRDLPGRCRHLLSRPRLRPLRPAAQAGGIGTNGLGGRFSATYVQPALWGTRNDFLVNVFVAREVQQSYLVDGGGVSGAIRHRFSDTFSAQIGLDAQAGRSKDALGTVNYRLIGVPASVTYDSTDSLLDPTRGFRAIASLAAYPGQLSDPGILVAKAQGSGYYSLDDESRYILAGRIGFGSVSGAALGDIPDNFRFFAGGGGSVRATPTGRSGPSARSTCRSAGAACSKPPSRRGSRSPTRSAWCRSSTRARPSPRPCRTSTRPSASRSASACATTPVSARSAPTSPSPRRLQGRPRPPGRPVSQPRAGVLMGFRQTRRALLPLAGRSGRWGWFRRNRKASSGTTPTPYPSPQGEGDAPRRARSLHSRDHLHPHPPHPPRRRGRKIRSRGLLSKALSTPPPGSPSVRWTGPCPRCGDPRRGGERPGRRLAETRQGANRLAAAGASVRPAGSRHPGGRPARSAAAPLCRDRRRKRPSPTARCSRTCPSRSR